MTPEQLDEIEKLAAAATPGPWTARLTDRGHALWGPLPSGDWGTMRIALSSHAEFDRANMLFVETLRDAALPLVKALREARARCETLRELADEKAYEAGLYARRMEQAQKARSKAWAEVERLREAARQVHALAEKGRDFAASEAVRDIYKVTKGMVE